MGRKGKAKKMVLNFKTSCVTFKCNHSRANDYQKSEGTDGEQKTKEKEQRKTRLPYIK